MMLTSRLFFCLTLLTSGMLLFTACGNEKTTKNEPEATPSRQLEYEREITFLNSNGEPISTIQAAIADEPAERNQGLMDINELPADAGMLFIFPEEQQLSFYMANTPLPLDIIYVDNDSTIVRIHHSTTPFSSNQLRSGQPARYVVETNGGYCVSNDIREGQKIRF